MGVVVVGVVDTMARLAQWRIDDPGKTSGHLQSPLFKIGDWDWTLMISKCPSHDAIWIVPKPCYQGPPIASFNMRLVSLVGGRKTLARVEIRDKLLPLDDSYNMRPHVPLTRSFIIEVEFLDLKTASPKGGKPRSIWRERCVKNVTTTSAIGTMFSEQILTDITICASDGSIGAHRAVLAAQSPVFKSMFTHDLMEKISSSINIPDMSIAVCHTFLSYLYSKNKHYQAPPTHRLGLLKAADKYDVPNLKDACQDSLIEDIYSENVLERLQTAFECSLPRLKVCCIQYLVKFGKIFDIKTEFNAFVQSADRELVGEVVNEIISAQEGV